jgi:hypothetical protein
MCRFKPRQTISYGLLFRIKKNAGRAIDTRPHALLHDKMNGLTKVLSTQRSQKAWPEPTKELCGRTYIMEFVCDNNRELLFLAAAQVLL